ncbi:L,D-transpeptidase [Actinomadura rayongensis]|uniref:L,D-transpeptidase family protein n=1 Tax=Actinomadura rayongensis TaxID=1429076 RepID=A0A6I4W5J2_9ACTN|nr:L,D-transpeptidase [Actinomadura rayongensis]MXQ65447.1 L,D-transpeptidase family protein [Actinomadura rayongensis]
MPSNGVRTAAALGCVLVAATACGSGHSAAPRRVAASPSGPSASPSYEIATARGKRIDVFRTPDGGAPWKTLTSPNSYGAPRVFRVSGVRDGWLDVYLPLRPNGVRGWIRASDVTLSRTTLRLSISERALRFTVHDGDRVLRTGPVATGTGGTPTPTGQFFVTELVKPADPGGPYGAYAFGLSGYSPTLTRFAGGPGQIAVHGTNAPGRLGSRASHGCVRVANTDVTWMARHLPLGAPVDILP